MIRRAAAAASLVLLSAPLLSATIVLSPAEQTVGISFRVFVSAAGLSEAAGLDIVVTWDPEYLSCADVYFDRDRLPGFIDVLTTIDNDSGRLEAVLLDLATGGPGAAADSLLALDFVAVRNGETLLRATGWDGGLDPVLVDAANVPLAVAGSEAAVVIEGAMPPITAVRLHQNFPNPFNPGTKIRFDLPEPSRVFMSIYDPAGRLVRSLIDGERYGVGGWEREWDGRNEAGDPVPSGVYFCVLEAAGRTESRKLVVLR